VCRVQQRGAFPEVLPFPAKFAGRRRERVYTCVQAIADQSRVASKLATHFRQLH
jgi:hypothetical protein